MDKYRLDNFTTLAAYEGGQRYKVVTNDAGEELGIEMAGVLTTFDVVNTNGSVFTKDSYDGYVDDYYIANELNVPLVLYHNDKDIRSVAGKVKTMTKTESGVEIIGWIPRSAYYYNLVKAQITEGILQGFSTSGVVLDGQWREDGVLEVKRFAVLHASLVATPADTGAKLEVSNTVFEGFEAPIDNEVTPSIELKKNNDWRLLV